MEAGRTFSLGRPQETDPLDGIPPPADSHFIHQLFAFVHSSLLVGHDADLHVTYGTIARSCTSFWEKMEVIEYSSDEPGTEAGTRSSMTLGKGCG